ncbi:MAG: STAS domain-containing protein [Egibacteraceae bacterium]
MDPDLTTTIRPRSDGKVEVVVAGEVDLANVARFRDTLTSAAPNGETVVVDLTDVAYLDSAGIAVLYELVQYHRLELIIGPGCLVTTVLKVCGLTNAVPVHDRGY